MNRKFSTPKQSLLTWLCQSVSYLSSVMLAMWRPSGLKLTERTQRSFAPPAKMGEGGGKRWLERNVKCSEVVVVIVKIWQSRIQLDFYMPLTLITHSTVTSNNSIWINLDKFSNSSWEPLQSSIYHLMILCLPHMDCKQLCQNTVNLGSSSHSNISHELLVKLTGGTALPTQQSTLGFFFLSAQQSSFFYSQKLRTNTPTIW